MIINTNNLCNIALIVLSNNCIICQNNSPQNTDDNQIFHIYKIKLNPCNQDAEWSGKIVLTRGVSLLERLILTEIMALFSKIGSHY